MCSDKVGALVATFGAGAAGAAIPRGARGAAADPERGGAAAGRYRRSAAVSRRANRNVTALIDALANSASQVFRTVTRPVQLNLEKTSPARPSRPTRRRTMHIARSCRTTWIARQVARSLDFRPSLRPKRHRHRHWPTSPTASASFRPMRWRSCLHLRDARCTGIVTTMP